MTHSTIVGGSSCGRMIQCPGHRKLAQDLPRFTGNKYTEQGTALHAAAEMLLAGDITYPKEAIGLEFDGHTITKDEVSDKLVPAWAMWLDFSAEFKIDVYAEEQVVRFTTPRLNGVFGTADIICLNADGDKAFVVDWKFGRTAVDPRENAQGIFYAAAAMQDPDNKDLLASAIEIGVVIIQPDVRDNAHVWMTDKKRLNTFTDELIEALDLSKIDSPPLKEGKHCNFCPAKSVCPLKIEVVKATSQEVLNVESITRILAVADGVEATIKAAREMAHNMLSQGTPVPGWGLEPKRATRQWVDKDEAEVYCKRSKKLVADEYYDRKLKSPAQLEKVCKQKGVDFAKLNGYIASISSGTKLVRTDDPQPVRQQRVVPKSLAEKMKP